MGNKDNTLRSLGYTSIGTDQPTKAKLQAAARAAGMTLSEYMRELADNAVKDIQGGFGITSKPDPDAVSRVSGICQQIIQMADNMDLPEKDRLAWHSLAAKLVRHNMVEQSQLMFDKLYKDFDAYSRKAGVKAATQLELANGMEGLQ